jgi:hypothetical protein
MRGSTMGAVVCLLYFSNDLMTRLTMLNEFTIHHDCCLYVLYLQCCISCYCGNYDLYLFVVCELSIIGCEASRRLTDNTTPAHVLLRLPPRPSSRSASRLLFCPATLM